MMIPKHSIYHSLNSLTIPPLRSLRFKSCFKIENAIETQPTDIHVHSKKFVKTLYVLEFHYTIQIFRLMHHYFIKICVIKNDMLRYTHYKIGIVGLQLLNQRCGWFLQEHIVHDQNSFLVLYKKNGARILSLNTWHAVGLLPDAFSHFSDNP